MKFFAILASVFFLFQSALASVSGCPRNYPNGNTAQDASGRVYYPNGNYVVDGSNRVYYPNGNYIVDGSNRVYYPNGNYLRDGSSRIYYANGNYLLDGSNRVYWDNGNYARDGSGRLYYRNGNSAEGATIAFTNSIDEKTSVSAKVSKDSLGMSLQVVYDTSTSFLITFGATGEPNVECQIMSDGDNSGGQTFTIQTDAAFLTVTTSAGHDAAKIKAALIKALQGL